MRPYHGNHFSHVLVSLAHRNTNPRIQVIESLLQQTDIKLRGSLDTQVVVARTGPVNEVDFAHGIFAREMRPEVQVFQPPVRLGARPVATRTGS
jgi:hypothetical protein